MRRAAPWLVALLGAAALAAAWVLLLRETPPPAGVAHLPDSRSTDGPERPAALPGSPRVPLPGRDPGLPGAAAAGEGGLVVPALAGRLHGRVTDGQRVPLGGASVRVTPIDPESLRGAPFPDGLPIATVATAADGTFSVDAPEGVWLRVVAEAPDHAPAARVVTSRDAFVELALGPAGALVVEVVADDGKAVDDARVVALVDALRLEATTDARGEATFPALPPGTVFLRVEGSPTQVVEDGPVRVSHGETSRRLVVLPAAQSLEGVVVDDADGRPLAGAEVWLARPGRSIEAAPTDAEGRFGPLPAGSEAERQFVAVRADGYAPALEPVVLRGTVEGEPVGLEIRMRRAALWRGRVLDARGEPVEGAEVSYSADGVADRPMARATSDAGGWFTIEPPPPPAPGRRIVLHATAGGAQAALALRPLDPPPRRWNCAWRTTWRSAGASWTARAGPSPAPRCASCRCGSGRSRPRHPIRRPPGSTWATNAGWPPGSARRTVTAASSWPRSPPAPGSCTCATGAWSAGCRPPSPSARATWISAPPSWTPA